VIKDYELARKQQHGFCGAVWQSRLAIFLSLALLLLIPAAPSALCELAMPACAHMRCCMQDLARTTGPAIAPNCCHTLTFHDQFWFVSPDSSQAVASSLTQVVPHGIVRSFYKRQKTLRNLSEINHPIGPLLDPLLKTSQLLI
jgi:hypothetical protein